ncbi:MAG: fumarylacetoacetate hydrolase family protein [Nanoarchaeota archaeon]|nr:fumarylacetoacetate hydrolase family protein [Nanoarchaeota archaeon]
MPIPSFLKIPPTKIIAIGLNYKTHAKELNMPIPKSPILFMKPVSSIIGPEEDIILPEMSKRVDYEAELAFIIKKKAKNIEEENALEYIEGFTCLNDVTARDLQNLDGQWTRAKSFDTFCPIGPKLVDTDKLDPNNLKIQLYLNGELKQDSSTKEFIFKIEEILSFISKIMTLNPGDIITTGTPSGIGPMHSGDTVEVRIEKIGELKNYVK